MVKRNYKQPEVSFGKSIIKVIYHIEFKQNEKARHETKIEVRGEPIDEVYLRNSVIDLLVYELGYNPTDTTKRGYKKLEENTFELYWMEEREY